MTGVWTPQWLHRKLFAPGGDSLLRVSPGAFINDSPWPLHLKWLSFKPGGATMQYLQFKLSFTQEGEVNTVFVNAETLFADQRTYLPWHQHRYDFSPAFPLGPEEGLKVELHSLERSGSNPVLPGVFLTGRRLDRKNGLMAPAHLGNFEDSTIVRLNSITFDSLDFYNDGEETFWLQQLLLTSGDHIGYKINPNAGIPWMPFETPIPVQLLAPMAFGDEDYSSRVYVFPRGCTLRPRQRLGIEILNSGSSTAELDICLHANVEVM